MGGVEEFTRAASPPESPVSPTTREEWRPHDRGQEFLHLPVVAHNKAFYTDMYEQQLRDGPPSSASSINSDDGFYTAYKEKEKIKQDFDEVNYALPPPKQDPGSGPMPDNILETLRTPEQKREDEEYTRKMRASYGKMEEEEKRVRERWSANYTKNKKPGGAASIIGKPSPLNRPPVPGFWDDSSSQRGHDASGQSVSGLSNSAGKSSGDRDGDNNNPTENVTKDGQNPSASGSGAGQGGGDEDDDRRNPSDKDSSGSRKRKGSASSTDSDDSSESGGKDKPAKSPPKKARTFKDAGPRPRDYETPEPPTPSDSDSDDEDSPGGRPTRSFKLLSVSNKSSDEHGSNLNPPGNNNTTGKSSSPGRSTVTKSPTSSPPLFSPPTLSSSSKSSSMSDDSLPPPALPPPPPPFPAVTPAALPSIESSDESSDESDHEFNGTNRHFPCDVL